MRWARWLVLVLCLPVLAAVRPASAVQPARMLEVVQSPTWTLTVRSVERRSAPLVASDESTRPNGQWAIFTIDLENLSASAQSPIPADFALRSATGMIALNQGAALTSQAFARARGDAAYGDAIAPGETSTTLLLFDIPADAFPLTLTFVPAGRDIKIDECSCSLPAPGGRT